MKNIIFGIVFAFAILPGIGMAQTPAEDGKPVDVFAGKPLAAPHIHVEALSQFVKWNGKKVPQGDYNPAYFERERLGTVSFSSNLRVHIDVIRDLVHFPSYFELIDSQSGAVLGKYDVFDEDDAIWYFAGNGNAYLNQRHLSLCGPRYTRKITQSGNKLVEVAQPLIYLGFESEVESKTQLYDSPTSENVVAVVHPKSKVTVIGLLPGTTEFSKMAFLVKTPFGLTGWHVPRERLGEGRLDIYECN